MQSLRDPPFLLKNKTNVPQGDRLGLMRFSSNISYSWSLKSCISTMVMWYGILKTSSTPSTRSIVKLNFITGGFLGSLVGNTSKKY